MRRRLLRPGLLAMSLASPVTATVAVTSAIVVSSLTLLTACGSTQYIMSTKEGRMIVTDGKPRLDERTGMYNYYDSEGKAASIRKDEVMQIMER